MNKLSKTRLVKNQRLRHKTLEKLLRKVNMIVQ